MSVKKHERLVVFTRFPEPGKTKTRLIPTLGEQGAASLQRQMTENIISTVNQLSERPTLSVEVRHEGGNAHLMHDWLGPNFDYHPQGTGNLGQRMARAEVFQAGTQTAVIIGSDIPEISSAIIKQAFEGLTKNDLVLGPARDGGYYLIGMKRATSDSANPHLFNGIKWGSEEVVSQTVKIARGLGLRLTLLKPLADVDRPKDLHIWDQVKSKPLNLSQIRKISIIIPALNEAAHITKTLSHLKQMARFEVIVVDGGSTDETAKLAESLGAKVIEAQPCKAIQMNAGAAAAVGEVLVFLHADTLLPINFAKQILQALNQNGVVAGAFRLAIDAAAPGLRFIERVAYFRSRYLKMPYGDQALFLTKTHFQKIGGFPELPIMEDFILIRRLRRMGKIVIIPESVMTSSRRWIHLGILRTWLINQVIVIAYYLGIPPERMARWYRREKGKTGT
jgi:rSAM/selenodomain-associated transferase 2/rSAM/selenodomain-associated transferase 1